MKQALSPAGQESGHTLAGHGALALRALCEAAGLERETAVVEELWRVAVEPWGARSSGSRPDWRSDVGIDHTPFEYSIALGGRDTQVRFLVEAQGEHPRVEASPSGSGGGERGAPGSGQEGAEEGEDAASGLGGTSEEDVRLGRGRLREVWSPAPGAGVPDGPASMVPQKFEAP